MDIQKTIDHIEKFKNAHLGLDDTTFLVYETQEEAFPGAPKEWHDEHKTAGAYYPASNIVVIISNNNSSINALNKTIRREVFGHLALNRLNETDKFDLLNVIANAPSETWVGKYRDYLSMTSYVNLKDQPMMLAEEVVAHTAELSLKEIGHYTSIPDPKQVSTKDDLLDIIQSLKEGIHHGVLEQRIFPLRDDEQFKSISPVAESANSRNSRIQQRISQSPALQRLQQQLSSTRSNELELER